MEKKKVIVLGDMVEESTLVELVTLSESIFPEKPETEETETIVKIVKNDTEEGR